MKKNSAWNIRLLVDESFVPSTQRPSVLYWRLLDFNLDPPNQKLHNPNKYILCLSPRYISGWHDESSESDTDPDQADTDENEASTPEIDEEDKAR